MSPGSPETDRPETAGTGRAGSAPADAFAGHYPRLVRLAYLVLSPSAARHRRVLTAHALVQRALPYGRDAKDAPAPPRPPAPDAAADGTVTDGTAGGVPDHAADPVYARLRPRVLRAALAAERPLGRHGLRRPALPRTPGLRLSPEPPGDEALALEEALARLPAAARAAYALRALDGLAGEDAAALLAAAGVRDTEAALAGADEVVPPAGGRGRALLESEQFDPCALRARPTDPVRRRRRLRAAAAAVLAACVLLPVLPDGTGGWGPDGAAAPAYARNPAVERALDPLLLTRAEPGAWRRSARTDFSVWPARGELADDSGLLRRALAVWARPGPRVRVSAARGTPSGPAAGPARLLYAGEVDGGAVVLLYDGLRVVRYAEPAGAEDGPVALDFARTDGADAASAAALVVSRSGGNARYLLAPWVTGVSVVDLLEPGYAGRPVERTRHGLTDPVSGPPLTDSSCETWPALRLTTDGYGGGEAGEGGGDGSGAAAGPYLLTDLGELTPARLTHGAPGQAGAATASGVPADPAAPDDAHAALARTACRLPALAGRGVRTVNVWGFGTQWLPEGAGLARWVCVRADTWRGTGARTRIHFLPPAQRPDAPGAEAARAEDSPACGEREPRVLGGVLWKAPSGTWYLLAAGSEEVRSITVTGDLTHSESGPQLALAAEEDTRVEITAELTDGGRLAALH
ncbi:hypothetical protein V1L54_11010 [Streptomyces sp. TRM 70361]|uniref:hypothetical protein n=1 Tax=Streptomyces sp. TRM 70361 TaxID=3116553 RepID=UPI002E7BF59A|nr:hypothetical protein [Streptomyces sp. TRM 70361]MEE1939929.1 hypothetical protein [Streptomyces sp. TRM 70361]